MRVKNECQYVQNQQCMVETDFNVFDSGLLLCMMLAVFGAQDLFEFVDC